MGRDLNEAEDSEPIQAFYNTWLHSYVAQDGLFSPADSAAIDEDFRRSLKAHHPGFEYASVPWGVKVPRSVLMLSYWRQQYPAFRFIHVVRNGLDMAYSTDRRQRRMVGDLILGEQEDQADEPLQAMLYWARVNSAAAEFGELVLRNRYLRIRFEDLCADPVSIVNRLASFVSEIDAHSLKRKVADLVAPPSSLGRWREQPAEEISRLVQVGGSVLKRFSYSVE